MPAPNFILKQLTGTVALRRQIKDLLNGPVVTSQYAPETAVFVDDAEQKVATGYTALVQYMNTHPGKKVFLKEAQKKHDLALEGGGAFGFAHLGTLHAMALKGIWYDRVAGTSAGALAAALVAAGYRVDLNYRTETDVVPAGPLTPSRSNSLNQIMFEDLFSLFTDYEQRIPQVTDALKSNDSVVYRFLSGFVRGVLKDYLSFHALKTTVDAAAGIVNENYFNLENKIVTGILDTPLQPPAMPMLPPPPAIKLGDIGLPGAVTVGGLVEKARPAIEQSLRLLISEPVKKLVGDIAAGTGKIMEVIDGVVANTVVGITNTLAEALLVNLITKKPTLTIGANGPVVELKDEINQTGLALFRLIEYGGFWEGNYIRDWVERHLQQLRFGSGEELNGHGDKPSIKDMTGAIARAVLFKDLPMDLCIVAADMGPAYSCRDAKPVPVYFSRRTTPDYPVAEAVRRSMSLPFVFIARRIDEGYGDSPRDVSGYSNDRHHGHLLQDGGLFNNLPVFVFRDPDDFIFERSTKSDLKPIVISNISAGNTASACPDDVPESRFPEPVKSIIDTLAAMTDIFTRSSTQAAPSDTVARTPGIVRLKRSWDFISSYMVSIHQDAEIGSLLRLMPNTFLVDIPLGDPRTAVGSAQEFSAKSRLGSGDFAMSRTTKKWLVQNAFEASKAALKEYEADYPETAGKLALPAGINPYNHLLQITDAMLVNGGQVVIAPHAKFGDMPYANPDSYIITLAGLTVPQKRRQIPLHMDPALPDAAAPLDKTIPGCTWIRIRNESVNRNDTSGSFLRFRLSLRARVFVALDEQPAFATAAGGWREEPFLIFLASGPATSPGDAPTKPMRVFSRLFDAGPVVIPGPRYTTAISNIYGYIVLARPV